jgi:hypothetical protein
MIEVMKDGGGIGYKIPHIHKDRLEAEGKLPSTLSITAELLEHTVALVAEGEADKENCLPLAGNKITSS